MSKLKMKQAFIVLILLSILTLAGCNVGTDKAKELELKEKELALKERELELKQKKLKRSPKKNGLSEDDSDEVGEFDEEIDSEKEGKIQSPPFKGTIFLEGGIIKPSDPSIFKSIAYSEFSKRNMFDRRVDAFTDIEAYVFNAQYDDGSTIEVMVNGEFGSITAAETDAKYYAKKVGQLPAILRKDIKTMWIHKGTKPFGGGNNNILIHTGQAAEYVNDGILEETLIHEAAHTSLEAQHNTSSEWTATQKSDGNFISEYARDNPKREDVAESFLLYLALKYKSDRLDQKLINTINKTIPNRIKYFDAQKFDMHPIK